MFLCSYLNGFSLRFVILKKEICVTVGWFMFAARLPGLRPSPDRRESWLKGIAVMHLFPPVPCVPIVQDFRQVIQTTVFTKQKTFFLGLRGISVQS